MQSVADDLPPREPMRSAFPLVTAACLTVALFGCNELFAPAPRYFAPGADAAADGHQEGGALDGAVDATDGSAAAQDSDGGDGGVDGSPPTVDASGDASADSSRDSTVDATASTSDAAPDAMTDASVDATDAGGEGSLRLRLSLLSKDSCALFVDGTVKCWGENSSGEMGFAGADAATATRVPSLAHVVALGGGESAYGNCAVFDDGGLACWGANDSDQAGAVGAAIVSVPTTFSGVGAAVAGVANGTSQTCALLADHSAVRCWGWWPATGASTIPKTISGLAAPIDSLSIGDQAGCAVTRDGGVACWGDDAKSQLGAADASPAVAAAVVVPGLTGVVQVGVGTDFACALRADGTVACWGANQSAQVNGVAAIQDAGVISTPTTVLIDGGAPLSGVAQLAVGSYFVCARMQDGTVSCWGGNDYGQCGRPELPNVLYAATPVPGIEHASDLAAGLWHACAAIVDAGVMCWGFGADGELGDGMSTSAGPVWVVGVP